MKIVNATNWRKLNITVDWIDQIDRDGFTQFTYICRCGRKYIDTYIHKGVVSKKRKNCKDCKRTNIVPCRRVIHP
jgi:predicted SprT family Zn-dependent metalloprotease